MFKANFGAKRCAEIKWSTSAKPSLGARWNVQSEEQQEKIYLPARISLNYMQRYKRVYVPISTQHTPIYVYIYYPYITYIYTPYYIRYIVYIYIYVTVTVYLSAIYKYKWCTWSMLFMPHRLWRPMGENMPSNSVVLLFTENDSLDLFIPFTIHVPNMENQWKS